MYRLLLYFVFLHAAVFGHVANEFGTSYLKNSRLCNQWTCLNTKLGFPDSLPPKEQFVTALKSLLPQGAWQDVVENVAKTCYEDRPRMYTNTCPAQALMHCAVDQLIQNCPAGSWREKDACSPLTSLAGFKYMFSQSRYKDLEENYPKDRRPEWFLKNYFSSKCCDLPELFNSTAQGCNFDDIVRYHDHDLKQKETRHQNTENTPKLMKDVLKAINPGNIVPDMNLDPLECCDLSGFIEPSWRSECGFQMTWSERSRLTILNNTQTTTTVAPSTTVRPKLNDVKVLPQTCEKETCVFRKLNIISDSGTIDLEAFSKLLDNMTAEHNSWTKAKARVVTKCLSKPIPEYIDDCEINRVLACTFDILSENCPHAPKQDSCKHTTTLKKDTTCQISSSKIRPKNRRQFCGIPNIVNHDILSQCGLESLSRMEYVAEPVTVKPKTHWWGTYKNACQGSTDSTKCLLNKMGVLNKYGFLDYFKMKDKIREFTTSKPEWSALTEVYLNAFTSMPMYGQMCSTPKKLLNVLDTMLMTCPMSRRKTTLQCNRILTDIAFTAPSQFQINRAKIVQSKLAMFFPNPTPLYNNLAAIREEPITHKNPTFDFGILNSKDAPKVEILDLKPTKKPLILLPVYMRMRSTTLRSPYDGILQSAFQPNMP
ncbi:hypothetical protein O0L34_g5299 [Tuta absoluta]|nr:hypothetical protein O0L34_g5299 [Tuta absoluta]